MLFVIRWGLAIASKRRFHKAKRLKENSKKQANIIPIEDFSLTLHPNYKFEIYGRRKSPEISVSGTEENQ